MTTLIPCPGCGDAIASGTVLCAICWDLLPDDLRRQLARARKAEFDAAARHMTWGWSVQGDRLADEYDEAILLSRRAASRALVELRRLQRKVAAG